MSNEFVGNNRIVSKDRENKVLLNTFVGKLDWEKPKYPNIFIKNAIEYSKNSDKLKPYIIGEFKIDEFLENSIENSEVKVEFDESIDNQIINIKE